MTEMTNTQIDQTKPKRVTLPKDHEKFMVCIFKVLTESKVPEDVVEDLFQTHHLFDTVENQKAHWIDFLDNKEDYASTLADLKAIQKERSKALTQANKPAKVKRAKKETVYNDATTGEGEADKGEPQPEKKKRQGRPKKQPAEAVTSDGAEPAVKRRPGRPKKQPVEQPPVVEQPVVAEQTVELTVEPVAKVVPPTRVLDSNEENDTEPLKSGYAVVRASPPKKATRGRPKKPTATA